jgi:hypothetical protein
MVPGNFESKNDKCLIGSALTQIVTSSQGFQWIDEAKGEGRQCAAPATHGQLLGAWQVPVMGRAAWLIGLSSTSHPQASSGQSGGGLPPSRGLCW